MEQLPHAKSTQLFMQCARGFQVATNHEDAATMSAAITMAKALDTIVDDDHDYNSEKYAQYVLEGEAIPYLTDEETEFIRGQYEKLAPESQERWRHAAAGLGEFAVKRLDAETVNEYIEVTQAESSLMADIVQLELTDTDEDAVARRRYNGWTKQMMRTAYAVDTAVDIMQDYNEGNTQIRPSIGVVRQLGLFAAKQSLAFAKVTPPIIYGAIIQRGVEQSLEKTRRPGYVSTSLTMKR